MTEFFSPTASLVSLFVASFVAATLVPASSEVALFAVLKLHPQLTWAAIAVATVGNTLGGFTTYFIGRTIRSKKPLTQLDRVARWGAPALLFAWLPIVGDALVLAAGWLKLNWLAATVFQALGRFLRYVVVAEGASF